MASPHYQALSVDHAMVIFITVPSIAKCTVSANAFSNLQQSIQNTQGLCLKQISSPLPHSLPAAPSNQPYWQPILLEI